MKKIIAILLIVLVAFGLVACTDNTPNQSADDSQFVESINKVVEQKSKEDVNEGITSEKTQTNEEENVSESSEKHILVAYFSVTGNTKNVAEKIAAATDADIYEIKPAVEYTDEDINYGDSDSRTSKEQNDSSARPEIQSEIISLEGYDTIYIGYPIWWGEEPRILDTFVESYNFGNITMIPFCTSGSSSIGSSGKNLAENAGSGNWLEGKRFAATVSESEIKNWISELQ